MSAKQIQLQRLECDGCGALYPHLDASVATLRQRAAGDGWRHETRLYMRSNWPQRIDLCPACSGEKERA